MRLNKLLILSVFTSIQAIAGPRVELREPSFSGSGCPKGSADVSITPNAKQINLLFDNFFVEANTSIGHVTSTKNCDAVIRIKVPRGYTVAVERVRYNGINKLPFGSNAHLTGVHFFNHEELASVNKKYYGSTTSPFDISARVAYRNLFWTPCGKEALLTSRTNLAVAAAKSLYPASVQVDDHGLRPGITYDLLWRTCVDDV